MVGLHSVALGLLSLRLFSTCSAQSPPSLTSVLSSKANLSQFSDLLTGQFPQLLKTLDNYDSSEPITVLAPSNDAFTSVQYSPALSDLFANNDTDEIESLLAYHVIEGDFNSHTLNGTFKFLPTMTSGTNFSLVTGGQRVGGVLQGGEPELLVFVSGSSTRSVVTESDIPFAGGTLQIIDNFLIPPIPYVDTAETYDLADEPHSMTSFLGAIYSQPNNTLAGFLNTTKDITIFAPANEALEIVSGALSSMSNASFANLLNYHILQNEGGPLYSDAFGNETSLKMLSGGSAEIYFIDNAFFINSARIVTSDILIYNGVIHVIDNVLNPSETAVTPNPTSATQIPVFSTIATDSDNNSTAPYTTFLPNYVNTAVPTESASATASSGGFNSASSTSSASATSTISHKKSGASSTNGPEGTHTVLVWVAFGLLGSINLLWGR